MTKATLAIDALRDAVARLPDNSLVPVRRAALERLGEQGLPTLRDEDWKYTDLAPIIEFSNACLSGETSSNDAADLDAAIHSVRQSIDTDWVIIANGEVDTGSVENADVTLLSDSEATLESDAALTQLNTALLRDGLRIRIADDVTCERPIGILVIDDSAAAGGMSQARVEIDMAPNSHASFIELHVSQGTSNHFANSVVNLRMAAGARADYVRIQNRDRAHTHTGRLNVQLFRDSIFNHCSFDFGGALIRNDLHVSIDEPGAVATFDGLYLAGRGQHVDNHTKVDHRVGPAVSRQEYRGILTGNSRCIWNGKAVVHEGADGTDAAQANHNLLLSEKAEVDAKPELEIYADDVKCSHGTTVGQLDENSLYYLRTRGLDKRFAQQVLTRAFAQAIVDRSPVDAAQDLLGSLIEERLGTLFGGTEQ